MKAVVWTDAFQSLLMFSGQIVVLIVSVSYAGGWNEIWISLERGKRNNFFEYIFIQSLKCKKCWVIYLQFYT